MMLIAEILWLSLIPVVIIVGILATRLVLRVQRAESTCNPWSEEELASLKAIVDNIDECSILHKSKATYDKEKGI